MTVLLRPAADDDLPAVGALHFTSRAHAYAEILSPEALDHGSPEVMGEWWSERWKWEKETHRLTVAVDGGTLAGFSYLGPSEEEGAAELYAIHAAPEFVGTGVGRLLMLDALPALARIADHAVLWVLEPNTRARRFYERGGWVADGVTRTEPIGGEPVLQLRYGRAAGVVGGSA
ncbi:GNAT family N-acetyltransferase [Actinoplanes friuliensis]|jgi:GNAT superfamily N-acetyltransferase|uniref:Putative GCN5-related N-acetyltransferase n=1 Tax=Actinoplanes friuliensis DSM 7358 TaxID=1246995 RepID=U5VRE2_9ACTN|nr:GNAT family N-acetyltransferase [Actinoplanes friuliensis]AGZ39382.1 putative GCN5-related N-acetyltransferase [Actinoplanes friuliensis DSM 7358]